MTTITVTELQTNPDEFIRRIEAGEEIVLMRDSKPLAEIKPVAEAKPGKRPIGLCKGQIVIADDFDSPLPEEILREFEGR